VRVATCQSWLGQRPAAQRLLASVLEKDPNHGLALRTRGQIANTDGDLVAAEKYLRQAVRVLPFDYHAHFWLSQVLERQGKKADAKVMELRAKEIEQAMAKLGDVSKQKLSQSPNDPGVHCEMGTVLLSLGFKEAGLRWLESALRLKKDFLPAHTALAAFYRSQGDTDKAEEHERQARKQ
jgi:tetratricopeptide (TPR) repeat protein